MNYVLSLLTMLWSNVELEMTMAFSHDAMLVTFLDFETRPSSTFEFGTSSSGSSHSSSAISSSGSYLDRMMGWSLSRGFWWGSNHEFTWAGFWYFFFTTVINEFTVFCTSWEMSTKYVFLGDLLNLLKRDRKFSSIPLYLVVSLQGLVSNSLLKSYCKLFKSYPKRCVTVPSWWIYISYGPSEEKNHWSVFKMTWN